MRRLFMAALLALLPIAAPAADTATLTIRLENVGDAGGNIRLGVYDEAGFKAKNGLPVAWKVTLARPGTMTLTLDGIPPGVYGVKVLQDINKNGYFDFGAMLMEPTGISNDPPLHAGPPDFDEAKITLSPGVNTLTITLR